MENQAKQEKKKKGIKVYLPLILVVGIVLGGAGYYYNQYTKYISTDDAHLDADNVSLSPKIMGRIVRLYADEGDSVKKGELLSVLDSTDLMAQLTQVGTVKEQALASEVQADAKYKYDQENIKVQEVNFEKAQEDYDRAKHQFDGDVISKEQLDHAKKTFETAKAQLDASKSQLDVSKAQIGSAAASVESAKAQIGVIKTQLGNTKIYAPMDGIIAKRWLLPGDVAQPGQSVMTITNTQKLWVLVFIEETYLSDIHLNQQSQYKIDAFPGITFTGKVFSIGSNTASQFSLIPANNASGNFTKVTQRVPLKISIEGTTTNQPLNKFNLLAGMSAVVKIIKD